MSRRVPKPSKRGRRVEPRRSERPVTATRPPVECRSRRERHEQPGVLRRHRGLVVTIVTLVVITGGLFGGRWVLHQPLFRVEHVTLVGNHHESRDQILSVTGLSAAPAMIDVSTTAIARDIEQLPWVAQARVSEHWPNTVAITIREAHVVGVAPWQKGWAYVSTTGTNLGVAPANANLPTLLDSAHPTTWPFTGTGQSAAYVAARLPIAFRDQVREVVVNRYGSVSLVMTTPVQFVLGDTTQLHAKFVAIASVIKNSTLIPGDVVNVTVPTELAVTTPKTG